MDAMEVWMESVQHRCTPDDPLGKALEYAYKLWPRMRRLLGWLPKLCPILLFSLIGHIRPIGLILSLLPSP